MPFFLVNVGFSAGIAVMASLAVRCAAILWLGRRALWNHAPKLFAKTLFMSQQANQLAMCERHDGVLTVLVLLGEIRDSHTAYAFRDEVIAEMKQATTRDVIFDLSRVRFIGSVGFLAFLGVRRQLSGGRIVLCHMSDSIREVFQVCRLIANSDKGAKAPFEEAETLHDARQMLQR